MVLHINIFKANLLTESHNEEFFYTQFQTQTQKLKET